MFHLMPKTPPHSANTVYGAFCSCTGATTGEDGLWGLTSKAMPWPDKYNLGRKETCAKGGYSMGGGGIYWGKILNFCLEGSVCFTCLWPLHSAYYAYTTQSRVSLGVIKRYSLKPLSLHNLDTPNIL